MATGRRSFDRRGHLKRVRSPKGWVYRGDWRDSAGKRHRKILSPDKAEAAKMLARIIRERDKAEVGMAHEDAQEMPLADLRDRYLAELERRRRPAYVARMRAALDKVLASLGATRVQDATKQRLLAFRARRLSDGVANRTANIECGALRAMLRWAGEEDIIGSSPLHGFRRLPEDESTERKRRRALTEEEVGRFLDAARAEDSRMAAHAAAKRTIEGGTKGPGYAAKERRPLVPQLPLWELFIARGPRFGEAAGATWADLDAAASTLTVQATVAKGRRSRVVPLPRDLTGSLVTLKALHTRVTGKVPSQRGRIFLSPQGAPLEAHNARRRLRRILKAAEIPERDDQGRSLDIHALRTSATTRLLRHGVPVEKVAMIVGHADVRVTMRYYTDLRVADLEDALSGVPELPSGRPQKAPREQKCR